MRNSIGVWVEIDSFAQMEIEQKDYLNGVVKVENERIWVFDLVRVDDCCCV